jgi:transposase, IS5 family
MDAIVSWAQLCEVIEPPYPLPANDRLPIGLERMLSLYFVQHWFNLADEAEQPNLGDPKGFESITC